MKKIVFTFALLLLVSFSIIAQTINRKVALIKGQNLEQVSQVNMNMTQEMMGQSIEIKTETTLNSLIEVKDATTNNYSIASTVKRMVMNMSGIQEMKFDSDKKEDMDGQVGESVKDRIGKPNEFTVNKEGIITSVKGKDAKDSPTGMTGMMDNVFGENLDPKEGNAFQAIANIPAKGVKIGDTWTDSVSDEGSKMYNVYTLKEVKAGEGFVTLTGNSNINKEIEQQGMTMHITLTGNTLGEYIFDVQTGIIKSRKQTTKATGTIDAMGQSIPMTVDTSVTSTITRKQ